MAFYSFSIYLVVTFYQNLDTPVLYRLTPHLPCGLTWKINKTKQKQKQQSTVLTSSCYPPSQPPWQGGDVGVPRCSCSLEAESLTEVSPEKGYILVSKASLFLWGLMASALWRAGTESANGELQQKVKFSPVFPPLTPKCAKWIWEAQQFRAGCGSLSSPVQRAVSDSCYTLSLSWVF